jgi:[acyl-carrier-protein] S-malonyltransferase
MQTAILFPGQGSQRVGMGRDLALRFDIAKRTYDEADAALGFALSKICYEGPEDDLTLTQNTQPAILTTSIAVCRVLVDKGLTFDVVAGHSLGEWSALVAAGAMQFADAVKLTHLRGQYMQEAVPVGQGSMAALMGLDLEKTKAVCVQAATADEPVEPANLNGGGQIVISGHTNAIDRAIPLAKAAGAKIAKKLTVSAPFHCSMMKPAADKLAAALASITISTPKVPVVANVTAEPTQDAGRIKDLLVQQVCSSVRWEESIQCVAKLGVTKAYELGSGAVLKGLVKRIAATIDVTTIGEPHEVDAWS